MGFNKLLSLTVVTSIALLASAVLAERSDSSATNNPQLNNHRNLVRYLNGIRREDNTLRSTLSRISHNNSSERSEPTTDDILTYKNWLSLARQRQYIFQYMNHLQPLNK